MRIRLASTSRAALASLGLLCIGLAAPPARADFVPARAGTAPARADLMPSADAIFARAKDAWRARREAPFVTYNLRERYEWRGRTHDNWWAASYRDDDRLVAMRRVIVAEDEAKRLKGASIGINLHVHHGIAKADSLDTNADADAFPILEPQIEPNAAFGLIRREPKATLVGRATPSPNMFSPQSATPETAASASPAATTTTATPLGTVRETPLGIATEKPLRELARVEAVARDYTIEFAGTERVWGTDTYHLTLVPLHEPRVYRLRDLWIERGSYATVQLAMQGLFEGRPYDDARWTVGYIPLAGRYYVRQIRTDEPLRFGLDRIVTGLTFDFVAYEFPPSLPAMTFQRLL